MFQPNIVNHKAGSYSTWSTLAGLYGVRNYFGNGGNGNSYTLNDNPKMARNRLGSKRRGRYGRRRFKRRRRNTPRRKITRIWKFLKHKGLTNTETKYMQYSDTVDAVAPYASSHQPDIYFSNPSEGRWIVTGKQMILLFHLSL